MSEQIVVWQQGFIKGFRLTPYDANLYSSVLGFYENKQVEFCIKEVHRKPSKQTHSYYRGIILPIAQGSELFRGWSLAEIHKYFTSKYLKDVLERTMGNTTILIVTTKSTADISNKGMSQFVNDVIQELSEHGITIPNPIKQPIK